MQKVLLIQYSSNCNDFWHNDSGRSTVNDFILWSELVIFHNRWWNRRKNTRKGTQAVRRKDCVMLQVQVRTENRKNMQEEIQGPGLQREERRDQDHMNGEGQGHQWDDQGQEKDIQKINTETEDIDEEFFRSWSNLQRVIPEVQRTKLRGVYRFQRYICCINGSDATGLFKPNFKARDCKRTCIDALLEKGVVLEENTVSQEQVSLKAATFMMIYQTISIFLSSNREISLIFVKLMYGCLVWSTESKKIIEALKNKCSNLILSVLCIYITEPASVLKLDLPGLKVLVLVGQGDKSCLFYKLL